MAVALAWILCPIIFGICFLSQTIYFLYKIFKSRNTDYSGDVAISTIHISEGEAKCCMGWAWTSCIDRRTNRMTLKVFIIWYLVALAIDILLTVACYFIITNYHSRYV
ncbi:unnamed protein product [Adineta steineri]|uniref:Uncharacterized protein n=1 Tax=Adineta steineri TaxID=433720 RepID=A0A814EPP8_9BILA|nr:unnamed protein product [Adineta steineri]CAF0972288.1 unnamed protein product [Adineta steineri]CAF3578469.1 unnamed protein product [Adineta steineri]